MNRILASVFISSLAAFAGSALAESPMPEQQSFVGTLTRAEVQAELSGFRTARNPWSIAYDPLADFRSGLTREEVRAEYIQSRDEVAALNGEDSGSFALGQDHELDSQVAGSPMRAE